MLYVLYNNICKHISDIKNHDSYRKLIENVKFILGDNQGINLLINNAGIGHRENSDFSNVSADSMRMAFEINALAPLMLSQVYIFICFICITFSIIIII